MDPPKTWPSKLRRRSARKQLQCARLTRSRSFLPRRPPPPTLQQSDRSIRAGLAAMFPPAFAWHNWSRRRERGGLAMTSGRRLRRREDRDRRRGRLRRRRRRRREPTTTPPLGIALKAAMSEQLRFGTAGVMEEGRADDDTGTTWNTLLLPPPCGSG